MGDPDGRPHRPVVGPAHRQLATHRHRRRWHPLSSPASSRSSITTGSVASIRVEAGSRQSPTSRSYLRARVRRVKGTNARPKVRTRGHFTPVSQQTPDHHATERKAGMTTCPTRPTTSCPPGTSARSGWRRTSSTSTMTMAPSRRITGACAFHLLVPEAYEGRPLLRPQTVRSSISSSSLPLVSGTRKKTKIRDSRAKKA